MRNLPLPEKLSYHVVFEPEPEGGFTVTVPSIHGCISYGVSFEEASENIREAILLCLEDMIARGEEIPIDTRSPIVSSVELSQTELHA